MSRKAGVLRDFSRCRAQRKECPDWASWRRERSCRQTLSGPFSMTYEPHKMRWMLMRIQWLLRAALHCCNGGYPTILHRQALHLLIWVLPRRVRRFRREKILDQRCYFTRKLLGHSEGAAPQKPTFESPAGPRALPFRPETWVAYRGRRASASDAECARPRRERRPGRRTGRGRQ